MNEARNCRDQLRELISQRLTPEHETWLNDQRGKDRAALAPVLSQVSRTVGTRALIGSIGDRRTAKSDGVYGPLPVGHWHVDEAAMVYPVSEAADATQSPLRRFLNSTTKGIRTPALRPCAQSTL